MTSAGTQYIPDVQQLAAHLLQLTHVLDFKADGEGAFAAGQILAVQFLNTNPGGGHRLRYIQQQTVTGDTIQLQGGFEGLIVQTGPVDTNPAGCLDRLVPVGGVGTVTAVNGNTEAFGNETNDGIAGNGGTAPCPIVSADG